MRIGRRSRRRALVGSATKLVGKETILAKRLGLPWQDRALEYYSLIGELNYCSKFYARMMSRCDFFAARRLDDENIERLPADDEANALLRRIRDPGGGRRKIQYNYGRLMFITGEGYLTVIDEGENEKWKFLWRGEVELASDGKTYLKSPVDGITTTPVTAYRMWTPHPKWSEWADSPMQAVQDIAEELLLLTAAVRSTAVSRTLNGILAYPTEISPEGDEEENMDDDPKRSYFMRMLIDHFEAQVENPGSAPAALPFMWEGAYEYLDRIKWIQLHDSKTDYMEKDMREEAIQRLEFSLDLPPEALKGLADSNHWSAQQVKWDMWQSHGIAIADQFAQDVAEAYLIPAAEEEGLETEDLCIGYDDSKVVKSPDQTSLADEALDRIGIGYEGYRKLKGIPDEYAPTEEEKRFIFGWKTRDAVAAGLEEAQPSARGPSQEPAVGQNGKALTPPQPTGGRTVSRQEARVAAGAIQGAANMAIRSCRAKAGARMRSHVERPGAKVERCEECKQAIDGLPNAMVASALGMDVLEQMAAKDPINLVAGGSDDFHAYLLDWGVSRENAQALCASLELHAATTLFDPNTPGLPPGFTSHVDHALEVREHAAA